MHFDVFHWCYSNRGIYRCNIDLHFYVQIFLLKPVSLYILFNVLHAPVFHLLTWLVLCLFWEIIILYINWSIDTVHTYPFFHLDLVYEGKWTTEVLINMLTLGKISNINLIRSHSRECEPMKCYTKYMPIRSENWLMPCGIPTESLSTQTET